MTTATTPPLTPVTASRDNPMPIDALGERIAELAACIHAANYELLVMLREYDSGRGWNNGFLSCAHWLNWRTGIDLGAACEKVRVARALPGLPLISDAMWRGTISCASEAPPCTDEHAGSASLEQCLIARASRGRRVRAITGVAARRSRDRGEGS